MPEGLTKQANTCKLFSRREEGEEMETIYRVIETVDGERYKWLHLLDYKLAQRLKMLCLYNMPDNDPQPKGE